MGDILGSQAGLSASLPGLAEKQSAMKQLNMAGLPVGQSTPTQLSQQATSSFAPLSTFGSEGGPGLQSLNKTNQDVWAQSLQRPTNLMADSVEQQVHQQNLSDENTKQTIGLLQGGLGALQQGAQGMGQNQAQPPGLPQSGLSSLSAPPTTITPGLLRLLQSSQIQVPTNVPYLLNR